MIKDKYLCVAGRGHNLGIEDVRNNNKKIYLFEELDKITQCIIEVFKTTTLGMVPVSAPISKTELTDYICKNCGYEDDRNKVEDSIQFWINEGLLEKRDLDNIIMHIL